MLLRFGGAEARTAGSPSRAGASPSFNAFRDRAGNVSIMFGLMLLPILLSIGGAVDFGRWLLARQQTISALDAAALAGARALQVEDASTAAAISMAQAMYKENTKKRLPLKSDTIVFNVGADKASIEVTGKATLQTYFLTLTNITELPLLNTTRTEFPAAVWRAANTRR